MIENDQRLTKGTTKHSYDITLTPDGLRMSDIVTFDWDAFEELYERLRKLREECIAARAIKGKQNDNT